MIPKNGVTTIPFNLIVNQNQKFTVNGMVIVYEIVKHTLNGSGASSSVAQLVRKQGHWQKVAFGKV